MYRRKARAPSWKKVIGEVSGKMFKKTSIIANKSNEKMRVFSQR
jgi:hypothetical protein